VSCLIPQLRGGEPLLRTHDTTTIRGDLHSAKRLARTGDGDGKVDGISNAQGERCRRRAVEADTLDPERVAARGGRAEEENAAIVGERRYHRAPRGIDEGDDTSGDRLRVRFRGDASAHCLRADCGRQRSREGRAERSQAKRCAETE